MLTATEARLVEGASFEPLPDQLVLQARTDLSGISSGRFVEPTVSVRLDLDASDDAEYLGFAFTQFALPVVAGALLDFDFDPAENLHAKPVILPLLVRDGPRCLLLAPLDNHHEQVISVVDGGLHWGWHGDLDIVPAGFATTLGVFEGPSPAELFDRWGSALQARAAVDRPTRSTHPLTSHLSYWTDNGAAYWYRTERGQTISESVAAKVEELRRDGVPVGSVELDSWFYDHEVARPITEIGYPEVVPPSGALSWTPRADAFTSDGIEGLTERLGKPPLTLHARHISPQSPYIDDTWWVDSSAAQPSNPDFFRRWFDDAQRWGAVCIEQDWMQETWFRVRELRAQPGRAVEWQRTMNQLARETEVDLMWCMATPADFITAVEFDRVVAVRTSDDYRFADDPAMLWTWFLTVNRMVGALGLRPFKDCFFSNPDPDPDDPISGDVHAELEALLSAMSSGPVGIGDRIGRTSREIVMRTCDDDGRLLQPDAPIAPIDDCLFGAPARGDRLMWATAHSTVDGATWTYVVAINTATTKVPVSDALPLAEIGIDGSRHVYDWRARVGATGSVIDIELGSRDWALFVICPPDSTDIGNPTKYATKAHPEIG